MTANCVVPIETPLSARDEDLRVVRHQGKRSIESKEISSLFRYFLQLVKFLPRSLRQHDFLLIVLLVIRFDSGEFPGGTAGAGAV